VAAIAAVVKECTIEVERVEKIDTTGKKGAA